VGISLDEDDGTVEVSIKGVTKRLDLYQARARINDLAKRHEDDGQEAWLGALQEMLADHGFPPVSTRLAARLVEEIDAAIADLKKKDGESKRQGSPASTAPVPSPSQGPTG
jgi:hypothetical protein